MGEDWSYWKEREYLGAMAHQRFNFFILTFVITQQIVFSVDSSFEKLLISSLGLILHFLMFVAVHSIARSVDRVKGAIRAGGNSRDLEILRMSSNAFEDGDQFDKFKRELLELVKSEKDRHIFSYVIPLYCISINFIEVLWFLVKCSLHGQ